jgi:putative sterol carrier protein
VRYFTQEFFDELARRLNADADWGKKSAGLTVKVTLTISDRATSYMLDVANGAVTAKKVAAEDAADFKFEAAYEVWAKVAAGATDFNTAVLTGKMKFKGSLPKIMGIQPQMTRLTQVAKDIPAEV